MATALPPKKGAASSSSSSKKRRPSSKKFVPNLEPTTLPEMEEDLDLVEYVLRAIGVLQAIQHIGCVRHLEHYLNPYQNKNDILFDVESGTSRPVKAADIPERVYEPIKVTKIFTNDFFVYGTSDDPLLPLAPPDEVDTMKIYDSIRNMRAFMDVWNLKDDTAGDAEVPFNQPIINELVRETVYWALTFIDKSRALIAGILDSAAALEKAGVKYWVLPNGVRVPVGSLRATIVETVPTHAFSVVMQVSFDKEKLDRVTDKPVIDFARFIRRKHVATLLKGDQLVIRHHVLSALLPDESVYIVDPTGRMLGYEGVNDCLVIYGSEKEYMENFPGSVNEKLEVMGVKKYLKRYQGPDAAFIPELKRLLVKYINNPICSFCGLIGGIHPIQIKLRRVLGVSTLEVESKRCKVGGCGGCKLVGYCGDYCQQKDWPRHEPFCTKPLPIRPQEPRPEELRPAEPRLAEPRPAEPRPAEPRPEELRLAELRLAEPRPAERRPEEPRSAERRPAEPRSAERRPAERRPAEPRSAERRRAERRPRPEEPSN